MNYSRCIPAVPLGVPTALSCHNNQISRVGSALCDRSLVPPLGADDFPATFAVLPAVRPVPNGDQQSTHNPGSNQNNQNYFPIFPTKSQKGIKTIKIKDLRAAEQNLCYTFAVPPLGIRGDLTGVAAARFFSAVAACQAYSEFASALCYTFPVPPLSARLAFPATHYLLPATFRIPNNQ